MVQVEVAQVVRVMCHLLRPEEAALQILGVAAVVVPHQQTWRRQAQAAQVS